MRASSIFRGSGLSLIVITTLSLTDPQTAAAVSGSESLVVGRFLTAVDAYVVRRHRLFKPLGDEIMCLPEETVAMLNALARVPRAVRPLPFQGDIFSPDVADLFRRRVAVAWRGLKYAHAELLPEVDDEGPITSRVLVNEPLPWGVGHDIAAALGGALPQLPEELAYRLVGRDLVLIDVESNLVVDVVRAALPTYSRALAPGPRLD